MTDEKIIAIRDDHLPNQGEPFDILAFSRALLKAAEDEALAENPLNEYRKFADMPTPKPQQGTWTLTAPDGRTWQAETPLRCCAMENRERVPAHVALGRIARGLDDDK